MSALPLFYVANCADLGDTIELNSDQAAHILGARRLRLDDALQITDGQGHCLDAVIAQIGPRNKSLTLSINRRYFVDQPAQQIILASAIAKGDRQAALIDMACQLGVTQIWPTQFEHSVSTASANALERWRRIIIHACQQSRRLWFPALAPLTPYVQLLDQDQTSQALVLLAHQHGARIEKPLCSALAQAQKIIMVVGPEGGLSEREFNLAAQHGVQLVTLGAHILRIETACSAIIAAVNQSIAAAES